MNANYIPIKIVIADDHEIFREGFKSTLQHEPAVELVAEAANGHSLIGIVKQYIPDIIFMDIKMPVMGGIEATRILKAQYPQCAVIALSSYDEEYYISEMMNAGAVGYVLKDADKAQVMEAITTVYKNHEYFCSTIRKKIVGIVADRIRTQTNGKKGVTLTSRETEVLLLVCAENSNKEIAVILKLSIRTVEDFRKKLIQKTASRTSTGLVVFAIRRGIYKPG